MIPKDVRLYTWVDVEEVLLRALHEERWPEWVVWARPYWDALAMGVRPGHREDAYRWLASEYEPRYDGDNNGIILESLSNERRTLPVVVEETGDSPPSPRFVPSFTRPAVLWASTARTARPRRLLPELPPVIALHSFKGGVGRTVHAMALADALADSAPGAKVLLVDADLEAPGISRMLKKRLPEPPIGLADLLALAHGEPDPARRTAVRLAAERLEGALLGHIYVLPAFRAVERFTSLEIRPEHLVRDAEDPFILTQLLAELGRALGTAAVIIDLRAGLSELAAGLMLDPRVYRILVTSLAGQSVDGTCQVLRLLSDVAPSVDEEEPLLAIIISRGTDEEAEGGLLNRAREELLRSAPRFVTEENQPPTVVTPFDRRLSSLPLDWDEALGRIRRAGLDEALRELLPWLPLARKEPRMELPQRADLDNQRRRLGAFARKLIFAEEGEGTEFLATIPLVRLASDHRRELPISVVVGAKGSGKTYTFLQIVRRAQWSRFVQDAGALDVRPDAWIFPLVEPKSLKQQVQQMVQQAREQAARSLGFGDPWRIHQVRDAIEDALKQNLHEGEWRERWLDMMAWALGVEIRASGAGRTLAELLRQRGERLLVVIDGLEDMFQYFSENQSQQTALRGLLQDVPEWLEQQPGRPVGLLVFIRSDMVFSAVRQNTAQFLARYEPYALKWNEEEALKLVAWIAVKAGVLANQTVDSLHEADRKTLSEMLEPLWGKKLGSDRSKEARSSEWVISALSDFRQQIQARDLVRLLALAAEASVGDSHWKDRLLTPGALRRALPHCSTEKTKEVEAENQLLKPVFERLRSLSADKRTIPFTREGVGLDPEHIKLLEDNGVVLREGDEYYMPEIFRYGLNFKLESGARPRVLTLARRARVNV
ncbi:MAG: AAA family ATPase [Limnochordaceae bacterium]|nr:AAA family ATPase [Limnochordaceae bacterium]